MGHVQPEHANFGGALVELEYHCCKTVRFSNSFPLFSLCLIAIINRNPQSLWKSVPLAHFPLVCLLALTDDATMNVCFILKPEIFRWPRFLAFHRKDWNHQFLKHKQTSRTNRYKEKGNTIRVSTTRTIIMIIFPVTSPSSLFSSSITTLPLF